jgi:cytochrome P450
MGWIASVLAHFPAARQELRERPDLIRGAIEEILRFEPVSHVQGRVATRDVTWHGQVVPAGSKVFLLTGAACRDERRYEAPDTFDIHRKVGTHMAFGWGIHTCIGAHLARLEGRIATEELLARVPDWSVDYSRAEMRIISSMRGYLRLPLTF